MVNIRALKEFNKSYLDEHYKYIYLVDEKDSRKIDVGCLSIYPIVDCELISIYRIRLLQMNIYFSWNCFEADFAIADNRQEEEISHDFPVFTLSTTISNHIMYRIILGQRKE